MLNYQNKYKINTENFLYEPNRYPNRLHRNYYHYLNKENKNINTYNYTYSRKDQNYFNTRTRKSTSNLYPTDLNDINNFNFDFSKKNIKFNNSTQKIKLTYEFENISPNEISNKTKELIDLQSKMCSLDSELDRNTKTNISNKKNNISKNKNKRLSRSQKSLSTNLLSDLPTYQTNYNKIKRNNTYNELLNDNNKFKISTIINKNIIKSTNNLNDKNEIKIWKNKCKNIDKDILDVKNNIKKIKLVNSVLNKRINSVKEKEDKKYDIYDKNFKNKLYNHKLVNKLKLSEEIKKRQIELIIKMQKEVNNMRLKLHMLGESCV